MDNQKKPALSPGLPVDPLVVFLASGAVGLALGPQLLSIGCKLVEARSSEIANAFIDRFLEDIKGRLE